MDHGNRRVTKFPPPLKPIDDATFAAQIKASFVKSASERYGNMMGNCWMPQQMWPQNPMVAMMDPKLHPKMGPKQPNFMMYPVPMNQPMRMDQHLRMGPPMPMGNMMPPQRPKSPHLQMPTVPPMANIGPGFMMNMPLKAPIPVKQPFPARMSKIEHPTISMDGPINLDKLPRDPNLSPLLSFAKMEAGRLGIEMAKEEPEDPAKGILQEVISLLNSELEKANDLYDKNLKWTNVEEVANALMEAFKPVLEIMWKETKRFHKYSLDEAFQNFKQGSEIEARRDYKPLEQYFNSKKETENLMMMYHNISKMSFREGAAPLVPQRNGDIDFSGIAEEFVNVSFNQRQLLETTTALNLRAALGGDLLSKVLPQDFRLKLIEAINTLHFDLGTPPQCVSPPPEPAKETSGPDPILSKCYNTLAMPSQQPPSPSNSSPHKLPFMPPVNPKGPHKIPVPNFPLLMPNAMPPHMPIGNEVIINEEIMMNKPNTMSLPKNMFDPSQ
ncbi:hypothetical protein BEWA_033760 [Theileria equi strain WA]|uniref:Uncharacterized protein n=1 Tax=Theileria equi strain WA TaxID=1537102 RepID=L0AZU2_THEEQ|nr:hypothetical protein BEWA_033760 [Theileria equi strain WA]AFZ80521.1 hypothetical protein BEWA_033760 [Theileria equi strain WA]|eukprot:XP_004830187.1 hypothetical protein BEWA_033760 [Theileria equi strain WA]